MRNTALNLLARREHSSRELTKKLLSRNFSNDEIKQALATLQQQGLQSDKRFTEAYVRMRANRGYGPFRIKLELEDRGVEAELIDQCVDETDEVWQNHVMEVWQKKFHALQPETIEDYKKQADFLRYRGFTLKQINLLLKGR